MTQKPGINDLKLWEINPFPGDILRTIRAAQHARCHGTEKYISIPANALVTYITTATFPNEDYYVVLYDGKKCRIYFSFVEKLL